MKIDFLNLKDIMRKRDSLSEVHKTVLNTDEFNRSFHYNDKDQKTGQFTKESLQRALISLERALPPIFSGSVDYEVNRLDFNVVSKLIDKKSIMKLIGNNATIMSRTLDN
jgi:hypothetical protein